MTKPDSAQTDKLQRTLDEARDRLRENHRQHPGLQVARMYSEDIDRLLQNHCRDLLVKHPEFVPVANRLVLLATGGYGRRELNLFSDVDLLFLFRDEPREEGEEFIKAFIYPLWNLRVELGYSVKTVSQLLEELGDDLDLTTALCTTHVLWGDNSIRQEIDDQFRLNVSLKFSKSLTERLIEGARSRHQKYQNTLLHLEPSIKESPGGLRDLHVLIWLASIHYGHASLTELTINGLLSSREERDLNRSLSFLIELRNALHILDNRKTDVLNFERQIKVAALMGFSGKENVLPEEQLMRTYYEHVAVIHRLVGRVLKRVGADAMDREGVKRLRSRRIAGLFWTRDDEIWVEPKEVSSITRDPSWMMQLFAVSSLYGLNPDEFTLDLIAHHTSAVDDAFRRSPINRDQFLMILKNPVNAGPTLRHMHQSGFLDVYIPEFALVRNLPRIDYYHQFTVDEHLLRSVDCAMDFFRESSGFDRTHPARVARDVLRWDLLVFALLMHDVGKGEGRGHVIRGAHMIQRIAERMKLSEKETEILHLLIAKHQKMSHVALKRNPDDPGVPRELAKELGDLEFLRMLYVLTCCDLRAVSHDSWNDWRASLLAMLYDRTEDVLRGRSNNNSRLSQSPDDLIDSVFQYLQAMVYEGHEAGTLEKSIVFEKPDVNDFLRDMPSRYRHSTPPQQMARHLFMERSLNEKNIVSWQIETIEGSNYSVLHSVARDSPGLFGHLCGALASRGLNILSAQIYTAKNGVCVDVFQIQDQNNTPPRDVDIFDRLCQRLNKALKGEIPPKWESQLRRKIQPISAARLDMRPPSVTISNDDSAEGYTVIEVKAPDRPGLLFQITSVLDKLHVHIHLALVATESYQIVDVFYVTDWEHNRLEPGPETQQLRNELLKVIEPPQPVSA